MYIIHLYIYFYTEVKMIIKKSIQQGFTFSIHIHNGCRLQALLIVNVSINSALFTNEKHKHLVNFVTKIKFDFPQRFMSVLQS